MFEYQKSISNRITSSEVVVAAAGSAWTNMVTTGYLALAVPIASLVMLPLMMSSGGLLSPSAYLLFWNQSASRVTMARGQMIKMGLPQLHRCCFIFDLKTGCIIMGTINAVLSFSLLTMMIVLAAEVGAIDSEKVYKGDVEMQAAVTGLYAMTIILVFMFLCKFAFDIYFIYGVNAERPGIIKAYMILWIVFFLLSMFIFFLNCADYGAGPICTEVFYIAHNVYMMLVCRSFYKQLNSREDV